MAESERGAMQHTYFVAGAGSIGRRHHGNLEQLGAKAVLLPWRDLSLDGLRERLRAVDKAALVVATATPVRLELISLAADLRVPVYVEKPLAYRQETLDAIFDAAAPIAGRSVLGLMMRYHPALRALHDRATPAYGFDLEIGHDVRQWRVNWRFADSYAARAEGGGVLLDLCHEIDMAHCLFPGVGIRAVDSVGHRDFPGVDFATRIALAAKGGPLGTVSMDYLSPKSLRMLRLRGRDEVIELDFLEPRERRWSGGEETERRWTFERNDMFLDLMRDFIALVEGSETSGNPLLPRLDRVYDSAALVAAAWEAREFHGVLTGGFE